jgi:diguanylate cyclase (GGDEF)-like protein
MGALQGITFIKKSAERIRFLVRESDTVGRFGGDKFIVLLTGIKNASQALSIALKVSQALMPSIRIESDEIYVTGSIGVVIYPAHGLSETDLLNKAEAAMREAKSAGPNQIRVFGGSINEAALTH